MSSANPPTTPPPRPCHAWLAHFLISLFSIVMGTAGLAIGWQKAAHLLAGPTPSGLLTLLASVVFAITAIFYAAKLARHPEAVAAERLHPVRMNFFPTFSIGILLLAIAWSGPAPAAAGWLWAAGAAVHPGLHLMTMSS